MLVEASTSEELSASKTAEPEVFFDKCIIKRGQKLRIPSS